jgi:Dolichyl-phosphate-mannose-protein mannosyltransferase
VRERLSNLSRFTKILLVILVVAFAIRVSYVAVAKGGSCVASNEHVTASSPSKCLVGDELFYNSEADYLARGHGFNQPFYVIQHPGAAEQPAADHPPLTVMVLAPVSWVFDHTPLGDVVDEPLRDRVREHRYTMVVLGTLLVSLIALLGRRIGGNTVGLVGAGIAAIAPTIWVNDGLVMSETVTSVVVVAALLAACWVWDKPTRWRAAALGALCGLAGLARAEMLLLVPLLAIVVTLTVQKGWPERWALTGIAVALAFLVILPWVSFNLARFEDPTFLSTNDGLTLAGANCHDVYYGRAMGLWTTCPGPVPPGDQSQQARVYRDRAFDYIDAHKGRLPVVALARVGRTWGLFRPGDMVGYNTKEDREEWVTRLGFVTYYPTLILAIVGAAVLFRRKRRRELWVLLVPVIAVTLFTAVTYGQTRFRAAAEPSLAILAAVAIVAIVHRLLRSREASPSEPAEAAVSV